MHGTSTEMRWVVWSQDTFGHGDERDPPRIEGVYGDELSAKRGQVAARRQEAGNAFFKVWIARHTVADLREHPGMTDLLEAGLQEE